MLQSGIGPKIHSICFNFVIASLPFLTVLWAATVFDTKQGADLYKEAFVPAASEFLFVAVAMSAAAGVDFIEAFLDRNQGRQAITGGIFSLCLVGLLLSAFVFLGYFTIALVRYSPDAKILDALGRIAWVFPGIVICCCLNSIVIQILIVRNRWKISVGRTPT